MSTTRLTHIMVGFTYSTYLKLLAATEKGGDISADLQNKTFDIESYLTSGEDFIEGVVGITVDSFHDMVTLDKALMQEIEYTRSEFMKNHPKFNIEPEVFIVNTTY